MTQLSIRSSAPAIFQELTGLVKLFKPSEKRVSHVKNAFLYKVSEDLNALETRPPRQILLESGGAQNVILRKIHDLSDHTLAVGPRYQISDNRCFAVNRLGEHTSGVLVLALNKSLGYVNTLRDKRFLRTFHVKGLFGTSKENYFWDSRITCKSKYNHVSEERLSSVCASLQASHQRKMFEMANVDIQSEAAYNLALKGIIRPETSDQTLIYGIKLIEFKPPNFTLEIHAVNETEEFLAMLLHDIAIENKTVAHCTGISCIRFGPFNLENSLLRRHWSLKGALQSISDCKNTLQNIQIK